MDNVAELRQLMQRVFRLFGALSDSATPCGKPLAMAHAHALQLLLAKGELSQTQLGAELGIDKSNVARLCSKLVTLGQVVQATAQHDGRSRVVVLSSKGERLAREVEAASYARFRQLLEGLPRGRRGDVLAALRDIVAVLDLQVTGVEGV